MKKEPHGQPNNINILTLDIKSHVTGYGKHNRLVVFGSTDGKTVHIREDIVPGRDLAMSTRAQQLKVANGPYRIHPRGTRLKHIETGEPWQVPGHVNTCVDHTYAIVKGKGQST